jgi:thiol:disulfide interchange protein DsbC
MKKVTNGLAVLLLAVCAAVFANETEIRKNLEPKLAGAKIESVQPAPIGGLFEVQIRSAEGLELVYTDATGNLVIQTSGREAGHVLDLRAGRDLTGERLRKLSSIDFKKLPLDLAVKIQRGNGKRVLAMFSDPYCPACRQFERSLGQINDVTIYVFMYPVIRPENIDHSRAVWCAPDRGKAWLELAAAPKPKIPETGVRCDTPVDKVLALGKTLGVNSTPTFYLTTGERFTGGLGAADLRDVLDKALTEKPR